MLESGPSGSVRGVPSNGHPYRDPGSHAEELRLSGHAGSAAWGHFSDLRALSGVNRRRTWSLELTATIPRRGDAIPTQRRFSQFPSERNYQCFHRLTSARIYTPR